MADVPISAVTRRKVFTGSAGTGPYACTFEILAQTDIAVYFNGELCTLTTDYTVVIASNGTFQVTLVVGSVITATPDADDVVAIVGAKAIARTTDFSTGGDFFAATVNTELDNFAIFAQQLSERVDRAIKAPPSDDTALDMELPAAADRASKALGFSATGEPIAVDVGSAVTSAANVTYTQSGTGAVSESVQSALRNIVVTFENFDAAGDDATDDTAAIQAAIDAVYALGGGRVKGTRGKTYKITDDLVIGNRVFIDLDGSIIKQYTSNTPAFSVTKSSLNAFWSIENGRIIYNTQQTSSETDAFGVRLAGTNITSSRGKVRNITVENGYGAVDLPQLTGCHAFFIDLDNVTATQCAGYGFDILGDTSGAQVGINLKHCYVLQESGSEISTSRGFRFKRIFGLKIDNCQADHVQNPNIFDFESCHGVIGVASAESCDIAESSGTQSVFLFSGCNFEIGKLVTVDNTVAISGSADCIHTRVIGTSVVEIGHVQDNNTTVTDTSSGAYYTVNGTSSARTYIHNYTSSGSTPASAVGEFGQHLYVRYLDGSARMNTEGGKDVVFRTAAPTGETWAVGDRAINTDPAVGEAWWWRCTSAGTPGTWNADRARGTFTMDADASTTVTDANCNASSVIVLMPTNAAAATLWGSTEAPYVTPGGGSFTVQTADGGAAAGTETFTYMIFN
jgi:hypothetical protein